MIKDIYKNFGIPITIFLMFVMCAFIPIIGEYKKKQSFQVNNCYMSTTENPFDNETYYFKIIDIKGEYIKYYSWYFKDKTSYGVHTSKGYFFDGYNKIECPEWTNIK